MKEIVIQNGFVATMDKQRTVYEKGKVLIQDDIIAQVGIEVYPADPSSAEIIDATGKVVLPGFVNAHSHLQQYFRGVYEHVGDFFKVNLPLEGYRTPEDMETMGLASCAEFIYGGCTTSFVIYTYPAGFAKWIEQAGIRVLLAADIEMVDLAKLAQGEYVYLQEKGDAAYQRAVNLYNDWHGKAGGLINVAIWAKAPDMVTQEMLQKCHQFAVQKKLLFGTHLSQSFREIYQVRKLTGKTSTQYLHDLGILNSGLTAAHFAFATEVDQQLLQTAGTAVVQCGFYDSPWLRWRDAGVRVGFGTDDYFHDMLPLLRRNYTGQKNRAAKIGGADGVDPDNRPNFRPTFYDLLEMATIGGAETLHMDHFIGSIEVGKKADIILINADQPYVTPTQDPLASVVLYASGSDVDTVLVNGKILKQNGKLTTIDMANALSTAQARAASIIHKFFQDYPDIKSEWEARVPYMPPPTAKIIPKSFSYPISTNRDLQVLYNDFIGKHNDRCRIYQISYIHSKL